MSHHSPTNGAAEGAGPHGPIDVDSIPRKWRWHFQVLQGLRDRLLDERSDDLDLAREAIEPHSQDAADSATDEFDHDMAVTFLAQHEDAVMEIGAALLRILDGTYGVCEVSGQPIPEARLRAVPWTRTTREVAERLEKQGRAPALRVSPAVSLQGPPPGGLVQAEEPEDAYAQAESRERFKRRAAAQSLERGDGAEEPAAALPVDTDTEEAPNP